MSVQNPHDRFFRQSFSRPQIIEQFIVEYLPPAIVSRLRLDTLTLESDSFVDEEFQEHQADMLYSVLTTMGDKIYLYLLLEHKSYRDPMIAWQLLRYIVQIWEQDSKEKRPLRLVLPIVIYHGEDKWTVETDFQSFLGDVPDDWRPYVPIQLSIV